MKRARGFTYITALILLAMLSVSLALLGEMWDTARQREREEDLLYVGHQYRKAIERYFLSGPRQYPRTLADLTKDPRKPNPERYLRKLHPDPITGSSEWGLLKAPDGGILGVHSLSDKEPLKRVGFRVRDAAFENAKTYADWKFVYAPAAAKPQAKPAQTPAQPPGQTPPQKPPAAK